jgi:hypothetical protein
MTIGEMEIAEVAEETFLFLQLKTFISIILPFRNHFFPSTTPTETTTTVTIMSAKEKPKATCTKQTFKKVNTIITHRYQQHTFFFIDILADEEREE